ncbi:hypothetical protein DPEC_G00114560 [Dallia pectoralis]|uniref:Uncharacterized protein n=1 Tax=Dallia pectoralis TaxID=75939 RepID=A0ACC2GUQ7_DALPE|nr:hypothetical protein DPEC_G00114560 [Dallia pectoralis]
MIAIKTYCPHTKSQRYSKHFFVRCLKAVADSFMLAVTADFQSVPLMPVSHGSRNPPARYLDSNSISSCIDTMGSSLETV